MLFKSLVSVFIWWMVLFIIASEILKSLTFIIEISFSPFTSVSFFFLYFEGSVGYLHFYDYMSSWKIGPFTITKYSMSLITIFLLTCILSIRNIATLPLFWLLFAWHVFSPTFPFDLFVYLKLKTISCRQHMASSFEKNVFYQSLSFYCSV